MVSQGNSIAVSVGHGVNAMKLQEQRELSLSSRLGETVKENHTSVNGETFSVTGVNPYAAEILNLCEAVENDTPLRLPIADALGNMRVIDALHESAHTGQRIRLPD